MGKDKLQQACTKKGINDRGKHHIIRQLSPACCNAVRWLSGRYPSILNIVRTVQVALVKLGSQSEETLLFIREQSLYRGASQSAVRRR